MLKFTLFGEIVTVSLFAFMCQQWESQIWRFIGFIRRNSMSLQDRWLHQVPTKFPMVIAQCRRLFRVLSPIAVWAILYVPTARNEKPKAPLAMNLKFQYRYFAKSLEIEAVTEQLVILRLPERVLHLIDCLIKVITLELKRPPSSFHWIQHLNTR